jgi:hypothetical protein
MHKLIIIFICFSFIGCKSSKTTKPGTVKSSEVEAYVSFLASDSIKGRKTGSVGIEKSAIFIEEKFKSFGLKPYFETYRDHLKVKELDAFNIVGILEGNDKQLKDEFIIIGAHYDHIGVTKAVDNDSIGNGANDNATGTSAVMAIANYFGQTKTNKRSLIFALFTAEEQGLFGSKHLAAKLKKQNIDLYTMLNFEMIGVPLNDQDYDAFLSGYDLSNMASKFNNYAGDKTIGKSDVAVKYNLFKRSDNYPFYEEFMLPCHSISSCDLNNYDFYHHVDDETEKMDFEFMASLINKLIPAFEKMSNSPTKEIKMYGTN